MCFCGCGESEQKGKKETIKREELECVGGVISRKITRKRERYVRTGVAVVSINIDIDIRISIINNRLSCVYGLFVCLGLPTRVALLCCRQTIDPKERHHTVRAAFLSMLADSVCSLLLLLLLCFFFLSVGMFFKSPI